MPVASTRVAGNASFVQLQNCLVTMLSFFSGWCSVTIFLTDSGGTVTQHGYNFLAVDGFPFFGGSEFGGYGHSNYGGNFTAVTQHDGNFLAVDGFWFFDGNEFGGYGNSNYDGTFTAVTQHDGNLPAADGFRFLGAASKWPYAKHIPGTEEKAETTIFYFLNLS